MVQTSSWPAPLSGASAHALQFAPSPNGRSYDFALLECGRGRRPRPPEYVGRRMDLIWERAVTSGSLNSCCCKVIRFKPSINRSQFEREFPAIWLTIMGLTFLDVSLIGLADFTHLFPTVSPSLHPHLRPKPVRRIERGKSGKSRWQRTSLPPPSNLLSTTRTTHTCSACTHAREIHLQYLTALNKVKCLLTMLNEYCIN